MWLQEPGVHWPVCSSTPRRVVRNWTHRTVSLTSVGNDHKAASQINRLLAYWSRLISSHSPLKETLLSHIYTLASTGN
jgi:hypothetical protein